MWNDAKDVCHVLKCGLKDSLNIPPIWNVFKKDRIMRDAMLHCVSLNGLFVGIIAFVNYIISPFFHNVLPLSDWISTIVDGLLGMIFAAFFILPTFMIGLMRNKEYYLKIAHRMQFIVQRVHEQQQHELTTTINQNVRVLWS